MRIKNIFTVALTAIVGLSSVGITSANAENKSNYTENNLSIADQKNSAESGQKTLVAYYSASGTTEKIAGYIAEEMNADVFVITPKDEYTSADLNYSNSSSRVVIEHNNPDTRHVELVQTTPDNFDEYDNVFIGYPIWWQEAAWVVDDFVKENDFTGKNVVPFCTSASSPLGQSGTKLAAMAGTGNWLDGMRFSYSASKETVQKWAAELELPVNEKPSEPETTAPTESTEPTESTTDKKDDTSYSGKKNLVAYYSASGTTEKIAGYIAEQTDADVFVITPKNEYTSADLNYTDSNSRVVVEHNNPDTRHVELTKVTPDNFDKYDNVFIGYPVWWQEAAWVVDDFVKENDFTGKNVIPFCTSASSPLGQSGSKLAAMSGSGIWLEGMRFSYSSSKETVQKWAAGLSLTKNNTSENNGSGDVNRDGKVNSSDAVLVLQDYANYLTSGKNKISSKSADVNKDGRIDSKDAVQILITYANNLAASR